MNDLAERYKALWDKANKIGRNIAIVAYPTDMETGEPMVLRVLGEPPRGDLNADIASTSVALDLIKPPSPRLDPEIEAIIQSLFKNSPTIEPLDQTTRTDDSKCFYGDAGVGCICGYCRGWVKDASPIKKKSVP